MFSLKIILNNLKVVLKVVLKFVLKFVLKVDVVLDGPVVVLWSMSFGGDGG